MRESEIERKLVQHCRKLGILTYKFTSPSCRGVPDRILIHKGKVLFLELKQTGNHPTALQDNEIQKIRAAGARADWTNSWDETRKLVDEFHSFGETDT